MPARSNCLKIFLSIIKPVHIIVCHVKRKRIKQTSIKSVYVYILQYLKLYNIQAEN